MVTKAKKTGGRKKNVKVLNLKKETVKNLRGGEAKQVKGGSSLVVIPTVGRMTSQTTSISGSTSGGLSSVSGSSIIYSGR